MSQLTINDLKQGHLYRVTDPADADPEFLGAIVLATGNEWKARAITLSTSEGDWVGTVWEASEVDACFELLPPDTTVKVQQPGGALAALNQAIKAKQTFWDVSRALEQALGLDDPTDLQDTVIQDWISNLAVCKGPFTAAELAELQAKIKEVTAP